MAGKKDKGIERFSGYLTERGLKLTMGRKKIFEVISSLDDHFDVEQLAERLQGDDRPASMATLYRTLNILMEAGLVARQDFSPAGVKYEYAEESADHGHLVCLKCGKVEEFEDGELSDAYRKAAETRKFRMRKANLTVYGYCGEECRRKEYADF